MRAGVAAQPVAFVGCTYCAYSPKPFDGPVEAAPAATRIVETSKGPRWLCDGHAAAGTWEPRMRRVSRVAP